MRQHWTVNSGYPNYPTLPTDFLPTYLFYTKSGLSLSALPQILSTALPYWHSTTLPQSKQKRSHIGSGGVWQGARPESQSCPSGGCIRQGARRPRPETQSCPSGCWRRQGEGRSSSGRTPTARVSARAALPSTGVVRACATAETCADTPAAVCASMWAGHARTWLRG